MERSAVEHFLRRWRAAAARWIDFVPRAKNLEGLRELGLTKAQAMDELRKLTATDYCSGPEVDPKTGRAEVFVFGRNIAGMKVYIKVKIFTEQGIERAKCISFHPAEFEMKQPFAGGTT